MKKLKWVSLILLGVLIITGTAMAQGGVDNLPGAGWWSGQQIQNIGTDTIEVHIMAYEQASGGKVYEATESVDPGAAFTFTPFTSLPLEDGMQGSAVVRATGPIRAIVNVTNNPVQNMGVEGGTAAAQYQGFSHEAIADTLYFPLVKASYYNNTTTYYIQNAGSASTKFSASFTMGDGSQYTYETPLVEPNRIAIFSIFNSEDFTLPHQIDNSLDPARLGSLIVTSEQPMAGVVMEHATIQDPAQVVYSTRGFTSNDFDTKAYAPVIKDMFWGAYTGIQVQNVETENSIDVTLTYYVTDGPNAGEVIHQTKEGILPGTSHTFVQLVPPPNNSPLPMDNLASVVIESTGGQFVAIVNETNAANTAGITYSAIPDRATTRRVSAPLFKDFYYGATSGLQIQNVGTEEAEIVAQFSCIPVTGAPFVATSKPQMVDPGAAVLFFRPSVNADMFELDGTVHIFLDRTNCSVDITGTQNIVAIVNEMGVEDGYGFNFHGVDDNNYEGFNLP